jgi:hypothetical protein
VAISENQEPTEKAKRNDKSRWELERQETHRLYAESMAPDWAVWSKRGELRRLIQIAGSSDAQIARYLDLPDKQLWEEPYEVARGSVNPDEQPPHLLSVLSTRQINKLLDFRLTLINDIGIFLQEAGALDSILNKPRDRLSLAALDFDIFAILIRMLKENEKRAELRNFLFTEYDRILFLFTDGSLFRHLESLFPYTKRAASQGVAMSAPAENPQTVHEQDSFSQDKTIRPCVELRANTIYIRGVIVQDKTPPTLWKILEVLIKNFDSEQFGIVASKLNKMIHATNAAPTIHRYKSKPQWKNVFDTPTRKGRGRGYRLYPW